MEIKGVDTLTRKLTWLQRHASAAAAEGLDKSATAVVSAIKRRASADFQKVPSYLLWHKFHPDPEIKSYPPGTIATFARRGGLGALRASVISTYGDEGDTRLPIQLRYTPVGKRSINDPYNSGAHILRNRLLSGGLEAKRDRAKIQIGYTEADSTANEYIGCVLYGTKKMIPRPFLHEGVRDNREAIFTAMQMAFQKLLDAAKGLSTLEEAHRRPASAAPTYQRIPSVRVVTDYFSRIEHRRPRLNDW